MKEETIRFLIPVIIVGLLFLFAIWQTHKQLQKENQKEKLQDQQQVGVTIEKLISKQKKVKSDVTPRRLGKVLPLHPEKEMLNKILSVDTTKIESAGEKTLVEHIQEQNCDAYLTNHIASVVLAK